jgi:hypothetical protein
MEYIYILIPLTLFVHIVEGSAESPEDKLLTQDSAILMSIHVFSCVCMCTQI